LDGTPILGRRHRRCGAGARDVQDPVGEGLELGLGLLAGAIT